MAVVKVLPILQIVRKIEVMLPSDIQAHLLMKLPLEADTERQVRHRFVVLGVRVSLSSVEADSEAQKDIWGIGFDTLVVLVELAETEEVKLRHDVGIDELVLPFGVQLHGHLSGLEIVLVAGDTLGRELRLNRPTLGELIAELQAERLTRIHEDMRCGLSCIIAAATLQAELAEVWLPLRMSAHTRTRE